MDGEPILHILRRWPKKRSLVGLLLLAAGLGIMIYGLYLYLPVGFDFYHWYRPIPRAWLAGETHLYDKTSAEFYSPPWVAWLLLPFALLDMQWGMVALTITSAAMIGGVAHSYAQQAGARYPSLLALLAVACPYSLQVLFVGTLDAWSLLGVYLAYGAARSRNGWLLGFALLLAAAKPQNVVLTGPVLLIAARAWPLPTLARVALPPGAVLAATFVGFGLDWPLRALQHYQSFPPGVTAGYLVTSTYDATSFVGIPLSLVIPALFIGVCLLVRHVWRKGLTLDVLDLAVTMNAIVSPYMLSQSYLLLLALPWARLAARRPLLAAVPYLMSIPLLFRAQGLWDNIGLLDVTFPIILLVVLLVERRMGRRGGSVS